MPTIEVPIEVLGELWLRRGKRYPGMGFAWLDQCTDGPPALFSDALPRSAFARLNPNVDAQNDLAMYSSFETAWGDACRAVGECLLDGTLTLEGITCHHENQ